jgi:hypothetical protein
MITISQISIKKSTIVSVFMDAFGLVFIYLVPAISHMINLPVYFIEPMRLMLILAIVHTSRKNAYLLAFSMPLFSFLISAHPVAPKMLLIIFELSLNVFLFYLLASKLKNQFAAILISIFISKAVYYLIKIYLISLMVIDSEIFTTPILIQLITTLIFSLYLYKFHKTSINRQVSEKHSEF